MTPAEDTYRWLLADWKQREAGKMRLAGYRDSMYDVARWVSYCTEYKPIPYAQWLALDIRAQNREIPRVTGSDPVGAVERLPDSQAKTDMLRALEQASLRSDPKWQKDSQKTS